VWALVPAALGLALLVRPGSAGERPLKRPALILLISLDTQRADRLGCYGYGRDTSPQIDRLARQGVVFTRAGAPATQTLISHKSLLTARYPLGLLVDVSGKSLEGLATVKDARSLVRGAFRQVSSAPLLERLRRAGYRTAGFTDGGWMGRAMGFAAGFEHFDDGGGHLEQILPRFRRWWTQQSEGRWFVLLHAYDVHCPYWPREPFNSKYCKDHGDHVQLNGACGKTGLMRAALGPKDIRAITDHYDGGVAAADELLGRLFLWLRKRGLYDEALIVLTSDHGESLGEHEQIGHGGQYLEQLHIPLIVKPPRAWSIPPGRCQAPVSLIDVMPTILAAAGADPPDSIDGRSLLPLLAAPGGSGGRDALVAQITYNEGKQGITSPLKRALWIPGSRLLIEDRSTGRRELFDLAADPRGATPLEHPDPREIEGLARRLGELDPRGAEAPSSPAAGPDAEEALDPALREELRALGYAGE
jgi:arylsulfatase A-like enzyme